MKRLFFATVLFCITVTAFAQTSVTENKFSGKAYLVKFPSTNIDSTDTVYSTPFTFSGYDYQLTTTYPVYYTRLLASTAGKPRILCVLQGTNDLTNYLAVDTVGVNADSTETLGEGTLNLNSKKAAYYRFKITGTAGNRSDTYAAYQLYLPWKRDN
jgi:hypothetical protein